MATGSQVDECATIPAVVTGTYEPKGKYIKLGDLEQCYITGSPSSPRGIIFIYDAFGYTPQTLQAADLLSTALNAVVLIPDYYKGGALQPEWVPADTLETEKHREHFRKVTANVPNNLPVVKRSLEDAKGLCPEVGEKWGVWGLCWGGKIAALSSQKDTPFKVSGQGHGGGSLREDALAISIPHICLAAPSDDKDGGIAAYKEVLPQPPHHVEIYEKMFHGWMGAKVDLENEEQRGEYIRG
ncbi:MAG: hypothetical protein MMC33_010064 [Icmadophila ericetorum]|nr:hypothetical protein [Icmadophila ericetorum]